MEIYDSEVLSFCKGACSEAKRTGRRARCGAFRFAARTLIWTDLVKFACGGELGSLKKADADGFFDDVSL